MSIRLTDIRAGYDAFRLNDVSVEMRAGMITALIGPNGCGKSTLLKSAARHLDPGPGRVEIAGQDIARIGRRRIARIVSLLPQHPVVPPAISVRDLVAYGRAPHQNLFGFRSAADDRKVDEALDLVELDILRERPVASLSGGQRQRAFVAMCVAQDAPYMLFDEPTSSLDIKYQYEVLDLLRALKSAGKTVVVVLHDIEQAARYADELVVMKDGSFLRRGAPADVVTREMVREVFGIEAKVFPDPNTGTPLISPRDRMSDGAATAARPGCETGRATETVATSKT